MAALGPGHGWASLTGVASGAWGGPVAFTARGEFGWRLTPWLGTFVDASASQGAWSAGGGLRAEW